MGEWQPIETAPKDGTWIQAEIPGHGSDNVIAFLDGFLDGDENPCGCWSFVTDQEPPPDWTDGVCWASNEDEVPSVPPTRWKHLPAKDSPQSAADITDSAPPAWRDIDDPPDRPMRVLLYIPTAYTSDWDGADYGIVVGYYGGPGDWREQGTNHDLLEEWRLEAGYVPTKWAHVPGLGDITA